MKMKQLLILVGVLGAVYAGYLATKKDNGDAIDPAVGNKLFEGFKTENVTSIVLNGGKEEVTLQIKNGKWGIKDREDFPANYDNIDSLVKRVADLYVQDVKPDVQEKYLGQYKLQKPGTGGKDDETGTTITLKDAEGKDLASITAGKNPSAAPGNYSNTQGMYIQKAGEGKVYRVKQGFDYFINDVTNKAWTDKTTFFRPEKHKSVQVTTDKPENDWRIFREKEGTDAAELKLADPKPGEEFDTAKATAAATAFASASISDVVAGEEKAKAGLDKPTRTAVIETFNGFKYTVKIGAQVPATDGQAGSEEYYVSADVEGTFPETAPEWVAKPEDASKSEDEKKTLKEAAESAFKTELTSKKEKLEKEKALMGRIYKVAKSGIEPLLKNRSEFMKDKPAEATPAAPDASGAPAGIPGVSPIMPAPPVAPPAAPGSPKPTISATTPPISVNIGPDGKAEAKTVDAKEMEKILKEAEAKKAEEAKKPTEKPADAKPAGAPKPDSEPKPAESAPKPPDSKSTDKK